MITFEDYEGKTRCCYCFKELGVKETCTCEIGKQAAVANRKYMNLLKNWMRRSIRRSDANFDKIMEEHRIETMKALDDIPKCDMDKVVAYMKNPCRDEKMTQDNIKELQEILVQTCIDYINEHHISDLEEVEFNADSLQYSANHKKWMPSTDSMIHCYGQSVKDDLVKRTDLGEYC